MTERRRVRTPDGSVISYLVAGDGPTVVLLPGVLEIAADFETYGYIKSLSRRFSVIAIDPLGHGMSDCPMLPVAYAPETVTSELVHLLIHERRGPVCLWGFDAGAELGLLLARRRPDLVSRFIAGGVFLGDIRVGLRGIGIDHDAHIRRLIESLRRHDWEAFFDGLTNPIPGERQADISRTRNPDALAALIESGFLRPRFFLPPPMPTFCYWGTESTVAAWNPEVAEHMPIESAAIAGSHSDSFVMARPVIELVDPFLDQWSEENELEPDHQTP